MAKPSRIAFALLVAAAVAASSHYASAQFGGGAAKPQQDLFKTDPEGFTRARFPPADWPDREFTFSISASLVQVRGNTMTNSSPPKRASTSGTRSDARIVSVSSTRKRLPSA